MSDTFARLFALQEQLPFATEELGGTGGVLKEEPEDFEVEEIPEHEPEGRGEHVWLWVEKRNLDAYGLIEHTARALGIGPEQVGCAGLKDARAVTRQYLSVPAACQSRLAAVASDKIRVLRYACHFRPLHTGELLGNRFRLRLAHVRPGAEALAQPIVRALMQQGVPNYFGMQRFGRGGETLRRGLLQLGAASSRRKSRVEKLEVSALQAALFNAYLAARLRAKSLYRVQAGELLLQTDTGLLLWAQDDERDQQRFMRREVVPSGPLFGSKVRRALPPCREREEAVLAEYGLSAQSFAGLGRSSPGGRRPLIVFPESLSVEARGDGLWVSLQLPKGAYATVVLRELMKTDGEAVAAGEQVVSG